MKNNELIKIENRKGVVVVSSRDVSENFEKEHSKVIRSIETIKGNDLSQNWLEYFIPSNYIDTSGKSNKEYLMNRDGFSLLVMGFTGKEALQWKLKYIEAFNKMEETIKQNPYNLPLTYKDALSQLLSKVEENELLQAENAKLTPKAEYHDSVLNKKGLICTSTIAKDIGFRSAASLNKILKDNKVIYRDGSGVWKPYADYVWLITEAYADYQSYSNLDATPLLKWTEKGRQWIIDNFASNVEGGASKGERGAV